MATVRPANLDHVDAIMLLAMRFSADFGVPAPADRAADLIKQSIAQGSTFIEEDDGRVVGCIVGYAMDHPFMDYTVLASLFTCSYGKHGVTMLRRFIRHGRECGVDAINASTHTMYASPRHIALMERLGFTSTERGWHLNL